MHLVTLLRTVLPLVFAFSVATVLAQPVSQPAPSRDFSTLVNQPATHSSFSFDRPMLAIAQSLLLSDGSSSLEQASSALTGISVDSYHFSQPAFYTPETMRSFVDAYHAAGWKHLVNGNASPANSAQPHTTLTDLWLHFSGANIDNFLVVIRASHDMNVIQVTGSLRPLDLLHLGGHFGIPKVDPSAVMVPAPQ